MILSRLLYLSDMAIFRPQEILQTYTDFDIDKHLEKGFRCIFLDIDNTIAVPNTGFCDDRAKKFIYELKEKGFKVLIFSNNTKKRVSSFADPIPCKWHCWAFKPLPFSFWIACRRMKVKPHEVVSLGDQLITDVLGANLSGCHAIYCKQLQEKDSFITHINRKIEKFIWRHVLHEKV